MINPAKVTDYNRTQFELEEFLLFGINVAGKKSSIEAPKLEAFLRGARKLGVSPFEWIRLLQKDGGLKSFMRSRKLSPYNQRYNSYIDVVKLGDLREVTLHELRQVRGIGLKTSAFFLSHSRAGFDEPMLDTHILHYLRDEGHEDAPATTPSNEKVYAKWAKIFTDKAKALGKSVTDLDLEIWKLYSNTA
jgi:hypothetical protein